MSDVLRVLAVLALVAGNAFFVIGEYAVVTARRATLAGRAERGSGGARAALRLMDNPVRVISTVQVGITASGSSGAIGEPLVRKLLGDAIPGWLGFLIAFAAITYLSVVLGECPEPSAPRNQLDERRRRVGGSGARRRWIRCQAVLSAGPSARASRRRRPARRMCLRRR